MTHLKFKPTMGFSPAVIFFLAEKAILGLWKAVLDLLGRHRADQVVVVWVWGMGLGWLGFGVLFLFFFGGGGDGKAERRVGAILNFPYKWIWNVAQKDPRREEVLVWQFLRANQVQAGNQRKAHVPPEQVSFDFV